MRTVQILNIPNFYSSYYILGFSENYRVKFKMDSRFIKYNNKPILIFQIGGKIGIIDNDDPSGVLQELYDISSVYFVTNKLLNESSYSQQKVKPLYPHYPVNILITYIKIFNFNLLKFLSIRALARQLYILYKRPRFRSYKLNLKKENFIFFSSSIWKKEQQTNQLRASFIRFCKSDNRIKFEGGFVPRSDGNNLGFDDILNETNYSPTKFSKLSAKSLVTLNNPAVCGAVSWRLAEYLNYGSFVVSFPFKIELPFEMIAEKDVYMLKETSQYSEVLDKILNDKNYYEQIASNGKEYFETYCTPNAQIKYIENILNKKEEIFA